MEIPVNSAAGDTVAKEENGRVEEDRIVLVSSYFFPEKNAAANRLYALADYLSEKYRVHVCTAAEDPEQAQQQLAQCRPSFTVEYAQKKFFAVGNYLRRFIREFSLCLHIFRRIDFSRASLILISVPSIFILPLFLRKGKKNRIVLDVRDLQWEYLLNQENPLSKLTGLVFRKLIFRVVRDFGLISVTNKAERSYFAERFPEKRVMLVSNGIDNGRFCRIREAMESWRGTASSDSLSSDPPAPEGASDAAPFTLSYIGNVGKLQNLESLVHLAARLPKARFIIAGGGADLQRLSAMVEDMGLENVEFTGFVEWEQVLDIYRRSNVVYARLDPAYHYAVPSKLYEYLATGLPVVYEGRGAAADLLGSFERVGIADYGDIDRLEQCLRDAASYADLSEDNVRQVREFYIREKIFSDFSKEIDREIDEGMSGNG